MTLTQHQAHEVGIDERFVFCNPLERSSALPAAGMYPCIDACCRGDAHYPRPFAGSRICMFGKNCILSCGLLCAQDAATLVMRWPSAARDRITCTISLQTPYMCYKSCSVLFWSARWCFYQLRAAV